MVNADIIKLNTEQNDAQAIYERVPTKRGRPWKQTQSSTSTGIEYTLFNSTWFFTFSSSSSSVIIIFCFFVGVVGALGKYTLIFLIVILFIPFADRTGRT